MRELQNLRKIHEKPTAIELINKKLKKPNNTFNRVSKEEVLDAIDKDSKLKKIDEKTEKLKNKLDYLRNQSGAGLKTLAPQQLLAKLPIFSAQLQAGNNS